MDYLKLNTDSGNIIKIILIIFILLLPFKSYSQIVNNTKYKINSVTIKGNKAFSDNDIEENINISKSWWFFRVKRLTRRMIISDRLIIKTFYLKNGYLNATVRDSIFINERQKVDVFFFVNEGEQYMLDSIDFIGNHLFDDDRLLEVSDLKTSVPYNPIKIRDAKNKLKILYENHGKPLAVINDSINVTENNISLHFMIQENKTMRINQIHITNNEDVKEEVIRRELDFKPNDLYSKRKIERSRKFLLNLGLFSTVNINYTNIDTVNNNIDLNIYVRENDMRYWELNTGLAQKEGLGTEINTNWDISANWRHKNLTSRARGLGIGAEYGINITDISLQPDLNADISYTEPWLFGLRSTSLFRLFIEDQQQLQYDYTKYGLETSFIINPDKRNYLKAGLEISGIDNKYEDIDSTVYREIEREKERALFVDFTRDRRNDFLNPSRGHLFSFNAKITSSMFGGTNDYFKIETSYSEYFRLWNFFTFAYRGKVGYLDSYGSSPNVPDYEKYYLGGSNSMRGWENQRFLTSKSATGKVLADKRRIQVLTNFELRFPIYWLIGGETFIDGGNLVSDIQSLIDMPYRWNYGIGLTVATPLGPARVDFARPLTDKAEKWIMQFAISYAF